MLLLRLLLLLMFFISATSVHCQGDQKFAVVKDLEKEWTVLRGTTWRAWQGEPAKVIYLNLSADLYNGKYVEIKSLSGMDVFFNQKLIAQKQGGTILLNADSLSRIYSSGFTIGVYQKEGVRLQSSALVIPSMASTTKNNAIIPRREDFFLNFSILSSLLLAGSFILLFRTNPRLTLDYLNVPRLFSIQEREDSLLTTRVTSSVNLLFYLFCSACFAFALLVIFYFGTDEIGIARYFQIRSVAGGFLQWLKLIIIIASCLGLKLVLIYSFSILFKMRDTAALQFFNFIRMIFFITILISVISLGYFVFYGYPAGPHVGLLKTSMVVMSISAIMVFLKLLTLAPFSFFHLFSYLCASEIIPLVIILKVLLY
jgi:hypothetical protein